MVGLFGNVAERSTVKAIALLVLFPMGNKVFGNLVYSRLLDHKRDMLPFL